MSFLLVKNPLSQCVPPPVHRFSYEARFGQLLQGSCLTVTVGGRGSSTSFFQLLEAHSGLALKTTQLLDQTEAGDVRTVDDWLDVVDAFVCAHACMLSSMEKVVEWHKVLF